MVPLSEADRDRVTAAVTAAEAHTAGEIVIVMAERSDGYSDIAIAWAVLVAFTALAVLATFSHFYLGLVDHLFGEWNREWSPGGIVGLALLVAILKFAGMWLIQLWPPLKFWLIPPPIKTQRVRARAVGLYKVGADRRTTGRTGVLIYLSLRERRAEIVADEAIADKVAPEAWGAAMAAMLAHIADGRLAEGMWAGIGQVGAILTEHFPRAEDDVNELPDRLIEL